MLDRFGIDHVEVRNSGKFAHCCSGSAESISSSLTQEILSKRYASLKGTEKPILDMCPVCLGNLQKINADAEDLSVFLARYAN